MQKKRLEILAASISIDRFSNQYRAVLTSPGGRIFRRLGIEPSPGVTHWTQEPPEKMLAINNAACVLSNALADEGAFSARGRYLFSRAMKEYLEWYEKHRRDTKIHIKAARSLQRFGTVRLNRITRADVRAWIADMEKQYSRKTISNTVGVASACLNWHITEGNYDGANVFEKHEWKGRKPTHQIKPTLTRDELVALMRLIDKAHTRQAVYIAWHLGLRPYEIGAIKETDIDHETLTMKVRMAKSRECGAVRIIAVPAAMSVWIINHGWQPMTYNATRKILGDISREHTEFSGLCLETFRHNFSNMMRTAGVPRDVVDLHQGRVATVQDRHYNLDDPLFVSTIMRPYMAQIFDGDDRAKLALVKH